MPSKLLKAFRRQRVFRAVVGIVILGVAAFALYKLAHVPRPVDFGTEAKLTPATIKLGEQELIIEGPVVNAEEGLLLSCDSGTKGILQVGFDRARLDDQTLELFKSLEIILPSAFAPIDFRAAEQPAGLSVDSEPCNTRVELHVAAKAPAEIRIAQLGEPGLNRQRQIQITVRGAELVTNMLTQSERGSYLAPGCQKLLTVDNLSHSTSLDVTTRAAEDSTIIFRFLPLTADAIPWGNAQGSVSLDLGGAPRLNASDTPPFQARAVSIKSVGSGVSTDARMVLSARSEANGPLLTISNLRVFSDQIQVNVAGKGSLEIDGVGQTTDFLKLLQGNLITSALLFAANAALLAWVARLVFKTPKASKSRKRR